MKVGYNGKVPCKARHEGVKNMKKVGIVICNYNKADKVLDCIQSILEQTFQDYDLYVVDNASSDDSVAQIESHYKDKLTLLVNEENLGGSGGFNRGLREAYAKGYPYLMCVDNDAMLDENAVKNLVEFLDAHQEVGMAGSKIYHTEAPHLIQQFGQKIDFDNFCTEVPHVNMLEDGTMEEFLYVDSVAACSLMVRRSTIDKIGFMPEENFLYWDDTEWCHKCNLAGMKVVSLGSSKALHEMGAKKEVVNTFPTYYAWRNWIVFFSKYTEEKDLPYMVDTFLGSLFTAVYEGIYKKEKNLSQTVMLAYDDAIHGKMGKAGENRIFPLDLNMDAYKKLFSSSSAFYLEVNQYPLLGEKVQALAEEMGYEIQWLRAPEFGKPVIHLCESIFQMDDFSYGNVYLDLSECILQTEDDALMVINYPYSKRAFVEAQKPIFLENIRELRAKNRQ